VEPVKRVCLLTGASGLLGSAFIQRYADRYQIVAVHNREPLSFPTQEQQFVDPLDPSRPLSANGRSVYSIRADISIAAEIDRLVFEVITRFGGVDLLVNGAAVRAWRHLLSAGSLQDDEEVFRVNLLAPLRVSVTLANTFFRLDPTANLALNRNIVNISSTAGLLVYPDLGQALYAASKAALNHLTYHLASEFWDIGIRVNAVAPDTFPGRSSLDEVLAIITGLDEAHETGRVVRVPNNATI
jgi:NAD(P)-dependent dehydrogenase (short-subunit alcohol dehydrogenase family)